MEKLTLGIAERDITPPLGSQLYGYDLSTFASSVHDPLALRVLFFRQGKQELMMISAELGNIGTEYSKELRKRVAEAVGIPFDHIFLSAIHTHTGPVTSESDGWGNRDLTYCDTILTPALLDAVREAAANPVPVTMGYAVGESHVGVNRRQPTPDNRIVLGQWRYGCFDPDMTVISFRDGTGKNIASIVHYSAHATCAGCIPVISGDWPGILCRGMQANGAGMTAFFNGTEGDVGPRLSTGETTNGYGSTAKGIRMVEEMGGYAMLDAASVFKKINVYREAELSVFAGTVRLPLDARESPEEAKAGMERFAGETVNTPGRALHYHSAVAASYENGYKEQEYEEIPQTVARIGEMYFAGFPFEVFSEIGLRIKDAFGKPLCNLGLTNGESGYFPTDWELSRGGYEIDFFSTRGIQPLARNADFALVKGTLNDLEKLEEL